MNPSIAVKLVLAAVLGVFATAVSILTLSFLSFLDDRIQGRKSYNYALIVTDLNRTLASINQVLKECSVSTVSFNFRKKTGHYNVWFNVLVPRETNLRIVQRLSEVAEITQVETGNTENHRR